MTISTKTRITTPIGTLEREFKWDGLDFLRSIPLPFSLLSRLGEAERLDEERAKQGNNGE